MTDKSLTFPSVRERERKKKKKSMTNKYEAEVQRHANSQTRSPSRTSRLTGAEFQTKQRIRTKTAREGRGPQKQIPPLHTNQF